MVPLPHLSTVLWRERQLVSEPNATMADMHAAELDRAVVVSALTDWLGVDAEATLSELTHRLPAPWPEVFERHRAALVGVGDDRLPRSLADFLR